MWLTFFFCRRYHHYHSNYCYKLINITYFVLIVRINVDLAIIIIIIIIIITTTTTTTTTTIL